jgi:hypothetical protein
MQYVNKHYIWFFAVIIIIIIIITTTTTTIFVVIVFVVAAAIFEWYLFLCTLINSSYNVKYYISPVIEVSSF